MRRSPPTHENDSDCVAPPSKHMRLGCGLSSRGISPGICCFDVDLCKESELSNQNMLTEEDLMELFRICSSEKNKQPT